MILHVSKALSRSFLFLSSSRIMFKYALDVAFPQSTGQMLWMYGGNERNDDAAIKAAANEVRD
jgi:hypothetical protein